MRKINRGEALGIGAGVVIMLGIFFYSNYSEKLVPQAKNVTSSVLNMEPLKEVTQNKVDKLQIEDVAEGTGVGAKSGQIITVHYRGMFDNGEVFNDSYQAGTPISFILGSGQVIKGWEQGLMGMKVGGKRRLVIPSDLAYGDAGYGMIPPKATLVFEVELLEIRNK